MLWTAGAWDRNSISLNPLSTRFNEMLEGVRSQLSVKIFGRDFNELEDLTEKIQKGAAIDTRSARGEP